MAISMGEIVFGKFEANQMLSELATDMTVLIPIICWNICKLQPTIKARIALLSRRTLNTTPPGSQSLLGHFHTHKYITHTKRESTNFKMEIC